MKSKLLLGLALVLGGCLNGCGRSHGPASQKVNETTNQQLALSEPATTAAPAPRTPTRTLEGIPFVFTTNSEAYSMRVVLSRDGRHYGCFYATQTPLSEKDMADLQRSIDNGRLTTRLLDKIRYGHKRGLMVVDGKKQFLMDSGENGTFTADGSHFIYVAANRERRLVKKGNQTHEEPVPADFVVLDGRPVSAPYYDFPFWGGPEFSADGEAWAAVGHKYSETVARHTHQIVSFVPNQYVMLVNGAEISPVGESRGFNTPITFSPVGHDYAFVGLTNPPNRGVAVFHNGEQLGGYSGAGRPVFSRDGKHWGFLAYRGNGWLSGSNVLVLDGQEKPLPPGEHVDEGRMLMGVDDKHCLYLADAENGGTMWWWWLGMRSRGYEYLYDPVLSPDGLRMACVANIKNDKRMIVDGAEVGKEHPRGAALFSPDSKHVAFISEFSVNREKRMAVVLDGVRGKAYSEVGQLTWSPDSQHLAYSATQDKQKLLVTDADEQSLDIKDSLVEKIVFSADGQRTAAIVSRPGPVCRWFFAGHISDEYSSVDDLSFSPDGKNLVAVTSQCPPGGASSDTTWKVFLGDALLAEYNHVWPYWILGQKPIQSIWWDDAAHFRYLAAKGTNLVEVTQTVEK